jgi:hypothetical protein
LVFGMRFWVCNTLFLKWSFEFMNFAFGIKVQVYYIISISICVEPWIFFGVKLWVCELFVYGIKIQIYELLHMDFGMNFL